MEEAELLKERLQAITNKKKVQEDIATIRLQIDKEKLKLQHLKKKMMRDQWLMDGESKTQQAQEDANQTKLLQSNIYRMQKEIEALEREELNISANEGFILKRLKAIEKTPEDIIREAKAEFKSEPIHVYSPIPDVSKSYTPLNLRKHPALDQETNTDQGKPALFAMEINVQRDLRTGESHVLSTSTVSAQELQQRGIKVYDDGRKSVYALRSDRSQPGANGVKELSPKEVEELLRQAAEKKRKSRDSEEHKPALHPSTIDRLSVPNKLHQSHANHHTNGFQKPSSEDMSGWPELMYGDSTHYPDNEVDQAPHMQVHHHVKTHEYHHPSKGNSYNHMFYNGERHSNHVPHNYPRENQRGTLHMDPYPRHLRQHWASHGYSEDSKPNILNAMPADEPVTMIFMGYQTAEDDSQGYDGSVQAELVLISDGDGEDDTISSRYSSYHQEGYREDGTENPSTTGTQEIKKIRKSQKHCCLLM
ncbi:palmdelphin [Chanos chanos]|uniref:Palmdelphin n=1 Tax=Chanos chanos TaxID=29144 RepID=A0A6J2VCL3_CHACN|nr:palmdelphin-like [Chanos chanos]